MSNYTKSPKQILRTSFDVASGIFKDYSHPFSPRKYTQPQLFSCLVLKTFLKLDYRGLMQLLIDCPNLCNEIKLKEVPHYTTFQKASRKLLKASKVSLLLEKTLKSFSRKGKIKLASIDSSGFESRHVSQHFRHRKEGNRNIYAKYHPKMTVICDCNSHLIFSFHFCRGPSSDSCSLEPTLNKSVLKMDKLLGDAGYDGENNHKTCREDFNIRSFFPPLIGRPTSKLPKGKWRKIMAIIFRNKKKIQYGQRWQVETVFSMIKRNLTSALSARRYQGRLREMALLILTHNIAIIFIILSFSTEQESRGLKRTFKIKCGI